MAEYVTTIGLDNEPSLLWWVPYTIKKRDYISFLVNSRVRKRKHKFGIYIPNNIKEAIPLDEKNGNTMCQDAYAKEMYQVGIAFKTLKYGEYTTVRYKKASDHLIFDIKMDFTWKAWWVKDVHLTPDLED